MGQLLGPDFPSDIGLAVSGGGDSMAMLYLAHNWTRVWGVRLWVVTVDHGFRPESADEAAMVAEECRLLGWPHATLRWHWDGQGNKMDAARRGRLEVIDCWRGGLDHVLFAHTRDDLAETFVMRLKRGSGVEGLSAMQAKVGVAPYQGDKPDMADKDACWTDPPPPLVAGQSAGFAVVRPCLDMTRADLRHYLRTLKGSWVEDPSNDDPAYDRVRVRQALDSLQALGLGPEVLAETALRMTRARTALWARAAQVWQDIGQEGAITGLTGQRAPVPTGDILFDRDGFAATERDTQLRLLAAALQYVSGAEYRPRAAALDSLLDRLLAGGSGTLLGCDIRTGGTSIRVFREYEAVRSCRQPLQGHALWDGRWRVEMPLPGPDAAVQVRALGDDGWRQAGRKPDGAAPFHIARSLPAVWTGSTLLACPAIGLGEATARLWPMGQKAGSFARFVLSH